MIKPKSILYAGDSSIQGPAKYLIAVLKSLDVDFTHIPPHEPMTTTHLEKHYDGLILSDYGCSMIAEEIQSQIEKLVEDGMGLFMIGGWGSFSGPFGGWRGSRVEKMMPVQCLPKDDRIHFSGGAYMVVKNDHEVTEGLSFKNPPVIVGINDVYLKEESKVILNAKKIVRVGDRLMLDPVEHPLLVIDADSDRRVMALTTDLAPHWCGGLLDWGQKRHKLSVAENDAIEVGDLYIRFVSSLICWLVRA